MGNDRKPHQASSGLASLPKRWANAVQLVSTFGLAVFLVLYYVLVIRVEERKRYDDLRSSVDALVRINEKGETLLTADLERRLQDVFVEIISRELADLMFDELAKAPTSDRLTQIVRQAMIDRTSLLRGLSRKDGTSVSELLANRINNFDLPRKTADAALANGRGLERNRLASRIQEQLSRELGFI